jgi:hypothetical protein
LVFTSHLGKTYFNSNFDYFGTKPCSKALCLPGAFSVLGFMNHGNALSPLIFNFALEHLIREVRENKERMKFIGKYQFLVYGDDDN